jgi:hypothetical protein
VGAADAVGDGRMPDRIRPSVSGLKDTREWCEVVDSREEELG